MNVGATRPEESGDYFAWGETKPHYSSLSPLVWKDGYEDGYYWSNYSLCDGTWETINKYNSIDNKSVLDAADDAAAVNWGDGWQMPTFNECNELLEKCTWTLENVNGVSCYKVQSNVEGHTDKWIILPMAGGYGNDGSKPVYHTGFGTDWSSELDMEYPNDSYYLVFSETIQDWDTGLRFPGQSVRAVKK